MKVAVVEKINLGVSVAKSNLGRDTEMAGSAVVRKLLCSPVCAFGASTNLSLAPAPSFEF